MFAQAIQYPPEIQPNVLRFRILVGLLLYAGEKQGRMVPLRSSALFSGKNFLDERFELGHIRFEPLCIQSDRVPSPHSFRVSPKVLFVGQVLADYQIASGL